MPEPNLPPLRVLLDDCHGVPDSYSHGVPDSYSHHVPDSYSHGVPDSYSHHVNAGYLRRTLPELPRETRQKLTNHYGISPESAFILVVSRSKDISSCSVL